LGIGDWAQSPMPNPQSPSPIPICTYNIYLLESNIYKLFEDKKNIFYNSSINKNEISEEKKEQYKTLIAIDEEKLKMLEHKNLLELIHLIKFSCDLYLNDSRFVDKAYGFFKIIKNKNKKRYDIIIDDYYDKKIQKKQDYKKDEIENDKFYDNEKEQNLKIENDKNSMKGRIENRNSFIRENSKENIINFKTFNFKIDENQNNKLLNEKNTINKSPNFNSVLPITNIINNSKTVDEEEEKIKVKKEEIKNQTNKLFLDIKSGEKIINKEDLSKMRQEIKQLIIKRKGEEIQKIEKETYQKIKDLRKEKMKNLRKLRKSKKRREKKREKRKRKELEKIKKDGRSN